MSTFHPKNAPTPDTDASGEIYWAIAVTAERRNVLNALTRDAVHFFGHGPLMVTDLQVSIHISADGTPAYLTSAEFTVSN